MNIKDIHIPFTKNDNPNQAEQLASFNAIPLKGNAGAGFDSSKPATAWHPPVLEPLVIPAAAPVAVPVEQSIVAAPPVAPAPLPAAAVLTGDTTGTITFVAKQGLTTAPTPTSVFIAPPMPPVAPTAIKEIPVATAPVVHQNGFVSFLKNIGKIFAKVLTIGDALQQSPAIQAVENIAFAPAITGLITKWMNTAVLVETAGVTAVQSAPSSATGAQKAALVIAALQTDIQDVAKQLGASPLTLTDMQVINTAIVTILNTFQVPPTA